jgi:hypothetical protein
VWQRRRCLCAIGWIGYVEYAYAKKNKMTFASLQNLDGQYVLPDDVISGAAAGDWKALPTRRDPLHQPASRLADHRLHPDAREAGRRRTRRR